MSVPAWLRLLTVDSGQLFFSSFQWAVLLPFLTFDVYSWPIYTAQGGGDVESVCGFFHVTLFEQFSDEDGFGAGHFLSKAQKRRLREILNVYEYLLMGL